MDKMKKVAIIRGKYLNNFEMQNYAPLINYGKDSIASPTSPAGKLQNDKGSSQNDEGWKIVAFASLNPIHENIGIPIKKLPSPMDLPDFPYKLSILNRLMVDSMYLFGLERALKKGVTTLEGDSIATPASPAGKLQNDNESGFDLACTRETYFHFTRQALNAKKKGHVKKVLITCSETIPGNHEGIRGRKAFKQRAIKEADHFHCLTQKAKDCLIKEGCDPEKISVIGYGIDLSKFKPKSLNTKYKILNTRVLFVGRLVEEKGILDLLEACRDLQKRDSIGPIKSDLQNDKRKIELQIIGQGPLEKRIFKGDSIGPIKSDLQNDSRIPYKKMPQVYQNADIFVLPSKPTKHWEEYYGMALLEAMASGLPIISTKSGAIPEVVGDASILVKPGNIRELKNALLKLIKNKNMRQKLGQKARKRAEKLFDAQKQAKKIGKLWKHCSALTPRRC